ncbi:MAG: hypothetical protein RLZ40_458, partial [Actinomycetota bacterium]
GLSIVRTLVTTELGGSISMRPATDQDRKDAAFDGSTVSNAGTVVDLRIPTDSPR